MSIWHSLIRLLNSTSQQNSSDNDSIQSLLGHTFSDIKLLTLALTHRSVLRTGNNGNVSNERLEFLGDSILGSVISHQLYCDHSDMSEGDLTKTKSLLVNETTLSTVGISTGINKFIYLSSEEQRSGGRERASIISDAMEAIIGAVYLDAGYEAARSVILRLIYSRKDSIVSDVDLQNYKGELLELAQSNSSISTPRYEVVSEEGPDHEKRFRVIVDVGGSRVGEGVGTTKKEAEQNAARKALSQLLEDE